VFFGQGTSLLTGIRNDIGVKIREAVPSKEVTHVAYVVER
jgi:hypothetical protein